MKYTHTPNHERWKPRTLGPGRPSPLPYVGSKGRGIPHIVPHFPKGLTEMVSPFFGGGSLEIHMAKMGVKVWGYDLDPLVANFWKYALLDPSRVKHEAKRYYPIDDHKTFKHCRNALRHMPHNVECAGLYFAVVRSSYSGFISGGFHGGKSQRFTRWSFHQLDPLWEIRHKLSVRNEHFENAMFAHRQAFAYLDPPYILDNPHYYGLDGEFHSGFDQDEFEFWCGTRGNWIMSNNDCAEVRDRYSQYEMIEPHWMYSTTNHIGAEQSNEVLIFSPDLRPNRAF